MKSANAPAWAVSFADLCMLLLGFFVVLHAQSAQQSKVVAGIKHAFGGKAAPTLEAHDIRPIQLFEPGEAMLRERAREEMLLLGQRALRSGGKIRIESIGLDPGTRRFDGWELAAARTAAIARAIQAGGVSDKAITISIPAMSSADAKGQHIGIEVLRP